MAFEGRCCAGPAGVYREQEWVIFKNLIESRIFRGVAMLKCTGSGTAFWARRNGTAWWFYLAAQACRQQPVVTSKAKIILFLECVMVMSYQSIDPANW